MLKDVMGLPFGLKRISGFLPAWPIMVIKLTDGISFSPFSGKMAGQIIGKLGSILLRGSFLLFPPGHDYPIFFAYTPRRTCGNKLLDAYTVQQRR